MISFHQALHYHFRLFFHIANDNRKIAVDYFRYFFLVVAAPWPWLQIPYYLRLYCGVEIERKKGMKE